MNIPHKKTGKFIVASSKNEVNTLQKIYEKSKEIGLDKKDQLTLISRKDIKLIEPELECEAALYSPSSGIFDSHQYMQNLLWDAQKLGATAAFGTNVASISTDKKITLYGKSQNDTFKITTRNLILATGIHTQQLSLDAKLPTPNGYWLKGNYFSLRQKSPFQHLIYPVPSSGGLGTHLTLDLNGGARFGPDTEETDSENYYVDPKRISKFENSIRKYWPGLPKNSLAPAYAGIRPKLKSTSDLGADFEIYCPNKTNIPGLFVLHGIESPGLTSSLSLATYVGHKVLSCK